MTGLIFYWLGVGDAERRHHYDRDELLNEIDYLIELYRDEQARRTGGLTAAEREAFNEITRRAS